MIATFYTERGTQGAFARHAPNRHPPTIRSAGNVTIVTFRVTVLGGGTTADVRTHNANRVLRWRSIKRILTWTNTPRSNLIAQCQLRTAIGQMYTHNNDAGQTGGQRWRCGGGSGGNRGRPGVTRAGQRGSVRRGNANTVHQI